MADTLLQTVYERYEAGRVSNPSWPAGFSAIQREGTALAFPNMVWEQPEDGSNQLQHGDDDEPLQLVDVACRVRFSAYATSLQDAGTLAKAVDTWMRAAKVSVEGDDGVWLERQGAIRQAATPRRGPNGQFVYLARVTYRAMWNPE